jgi:hypothetical protein
LIELVLSSLAEVARLKIKMGSIGDSIIKVGLIPSHSITANSNRKWLRRRQNRIRRFLRAFTKVVGVDRRADWFTILDLLYTYYPDEGRKLIENFELSEEEKFNFFLDYLIYSPQITWLMFADERMGKDAAICCVVELAMKRIVKKGFPPPRIVTLGNIKVPPFVLFGDQTDFEYFESALGLTKNDLLNLYGGVIPNDRYWSFKDIPSGTSRQEIWGYSSELEVLLPARDGMAPENKLFSMISGTFAQNHFKLFGAVKLASKVDLNALRGCNVKSFKYIDPEKLKVANVERDNILSPLGDWLLPNDRRNKRKILFSFDSQLFTVHLPLPDWWTQEYSEQFNEVSKDDIWSYIEATCDEDTKVNSIMTILASKFRNKTISKAEVHAFIKKQKLF